MAPNLTLQRLREAGVSIWLDTLSRQLLQSDGFAELIRDYAVTGATSNPTIFATAITESESYDAQLQQLVAGGQRDARNCFSHSRLMTSGKLPGCSARPMNAAGAVTGSSPSSARPTSPTTPRRPSPRPPACGSGSPSPT
jgi:hypothetical protein